MDCVKSVLKFFAVPFFSFLSWGSRIWASLTYQMLFYAERFYRAPENFDHQIDRYYTWDKSRNPYWLERGIFNLLAVQLFEHPVVVELCCGDGFNAHYFYSYHAEKIYAYDKDAIAIEKAQRRYTLDNLSYGVQDIRSGLKNMMSKIGIVTNVIWDTAMAYFTPEEILEIVKDIHDVLKDTNGILSGHTIKAKGERYYQHKYEFKSKEDLERFFKPYFKNVVIIETHYKNGSNYYFFASDGVIPFVDNWNNWLRFPK